MRLHPEVSGWGWGPGCAEHLKRGRSPRSLGLRWGVAREDLRAGLDAGWRRHLAEVPREVTGGGKGDGRCGPMGWRAQAWGSEKVPRMWKAALQAPKGFLELTDAETEKVGRRCPNLAGSSWGGPEGSLVCLYVAFQQRWTPPHLGQAMS